MRFPAVLAKRSTHPIHKKRRKESEMRGRKRERVFVCVGGSGRGCERVYVRMRQGERERK